MNWEKIAELKVIYVQPQTGSNSIWIMFTVGGGLRIVLGLRRSPKKLPQPWTRCPLNAILIP